MLRPLAKIKIYPRKLIISRSIYMDNHSNDKRCSIHAMAAAAFNPNIPRAYCGEATSRPTMRAECASFSISGPFGSALLPSGR